MATYHDFSASARVESRLRLTHAMRQSLRVLEMSNVELESWMQTCALENPYLALRIDDDSVSKKLRSVEQRDPPQGGISFFSHVLAQAREVFSNPTELAQGCALLARMDHRGRISDVSAKEISVLRKIQDFDPPGIGARSLQESLLIQLRLKNARQNLSYFIIAEHFQDVLANRFSVIQKKIGCSQQQLRHAIVEIGGLSLHPTHMFYQEHTPQLRPDLTISERDSQLVLDIDKGAELIMQAPAAPFFHNPMCRSWLLLEHRKAYCVLDALQKRMVTLRKLGTLLLSRYTNFFLDMHQTFVPLSVDEAAKTLQLHPATVTRAISEKALLSPMGLHPLTLFFPRKNINRHLENHIAYLIQHEIPSTPMSDTALAEQLRALGIVAARRTVTKYRERLNIPAAYLRKNTIDKT